MHPEKALLRMFLVLELPEKDEGRAASPFIKGHIAHYKKNFHK